VRRLDRTIPAAADKVGWYLNKEVMNGHFAMDPESLQTFLANAFAVQESGLDKRSLAALIEIQHFLSSEEFDLGQGMQLIADRVLGVSDASGVAIGLLRSHELVYLAGSGSAAVDIGRHVPAVLSASTQQETRREILRVENAASDPRIEAEVCRQFGAMSLLMLPIYKSHVLAGVLQVLFEKPHSFLEREIRVYRLMVGALEEGMLRAARPVPKPVEFVAGMPANAVESPECVRSGVGSTQSLAVAIGAIEQGKLDAMAAIGDYGQRLGSKAGAFGSYLVRLGQQASAFWKALANTIQSGLTWHSSTELRNAGAAIGVAVALSTVIFVSQLHHSARTNTGLPIPTTRDVQRTPAGTEVGSQVLKAAGEVSDSAGVYRGFKRVRVGPGEVDYVSEDVTIRRFEARPVKAQMRSNAREVKFGDDVTLRYFVRPAVVKESPEASEASPNIQNQSHLR
jgi:hypothetical protein